MQAFPDAGDFGSLQDIITAAFAAISALFGYLMKTQRDRIKDKDREIHAANLRAEKAVSNADERVNKAERDVDDCERSKRLLTQEIELIRARR